MNDKSTQIEKCYCPICKHRTNHSILASASNIWNDEDDGITLEHIYRIVKCCGCEHVSFNLVHDGSEYFHEDGYGFCQHEPEYFSYPEQENEVTTIEDNTWSIPLRIRVPYRESVKCINDNCLLLAALGFRTTVEAICIDKQVNGDDLYTRIENLKNKGIITAANCERLHEARFLGNESAHEIKTPDKPQLMLVFEVINNILENLYVIDSKCKDTFEFHFKDFTHFMNILNAEINNRAQGYKGTIYAYLPEGRKYRLDDILKLQDELQGLLDKGSFSRIKKLNSVTNRGLFNYEKI